MGLIDEIQANYIDYDGLVSPTKCMRNDINTSGNGILYTSLYYIAIKRNSILTVGDVFDFTRVIDACQIAPGLYKRGPHQTDQEAFDDYVALASANFLYAREILAYGKSTTPKFLYNNVNPGVFTFSSWLGRMPQIPAHFYWCAGRTPPLWRRIWWVGAIVLSAYAKPEDQDAWLFSWLLTEAVPKSACLEQSAIAFWRKAFNKAYPYGIRQVLGKAISPDHPIARYF